MRKRISLLVCLLLFAAALASCSDNNTSTTNTDGNITLQFAMKANGENVVCGKQYTGLGTGKTGVTFTDMRFYVSNLRLVNDKGETVKLELAQDGQWQYQNVALLDFEDGKASCSESGNAPTHTTVTGKVPAGNYSSVIFDLGVPFELNHTDVAVAPAPLNVPAMWWNWQVGYKFVRIDLRTSMDSMSMATTTMAMNMGATPAAGGAATGHGAGAMASPTTWFIHLGSTGCTSPNSNTQPSETCTNPNLTTIRLNSFSPGKNVIVADVTGLLGGVPLDKNTLNPPGCMSGKDDPDCGSLFTGFGLNLTSGKCDSDCTTQKFFRLEGAEVRK